MFDIAFTRSYICAMKRFVLFAVGALLLQSAPAGGQVPLPVTPTWTSTDQDYSTGAALVDINRDGWLDLVVANGNDMGRQHIAVYYNKGDGTFPLIPDWQSEDVDYHGHLAVGDVNGDGFPDIAVSVYIGAGGFRDPGYVKLYMNQHGTLESKPSWRSADSMYTFSCAFGDANGDGLPDLAVACGEGYESHAEQNRIYYNHGGRLDSLPSWKSRQTGYSYDVSWGDFDNDGSLDLVFAAERGPNTLYKNYGDSLGTMPVWESDDLPQFGNSLAIGDVNNDGYLDLAVSDNNQLGGSGHFKIYLNNGGTLSAKPDWTSAFSGMSSGVALLDVTNDGWRDLVCGGWWQACMVYPNFHGKFGQSPAWTSSTGSVVEAIAAGDIDNNGLDTIRVSYVGDGSRKLFHVPKPPFQRLIVAIVGQGVISQTAYCSSYENGWVSLATAPRPGDTVMLTAVTTHSLDLAVSNWDEEIGNYVFMNTNGATGVAAMAERPVGHELLQNYPNPFNGQTSIRYSAPFVPDETPGHGRIRLVVFDVSGRQIATLVDREEAPGDYTVHFDGSELPSGVYFYRLHAGGRVFAKRMVLMK
jgi:hypothetical protein